MGLFGSDGPAQLGETEDPTELVPGNASGVADTARVYRGLAEGIGDAAAGLSKLDDSAWTGEAADAYRRANDHETPRWREAATAFDEAARALIDHSHTITSAQRGAAHAIELWRQAEATTQQARAQHAQQQRSAPADAAPVPFDDPGNAGRAEAEAVLADARRAMKTSSTTTADALRRARDRAPDASALQRAWGGLQDFVSPLAEAGGSVLSGTGSALGEMGVGVLSQLAKPMHLVTHPAETISAGANMASGMVSMVAHPGQTLSSIVGSPAEWRNDPAAAFGKAWTNVGTTIATGGAGVAAKVGVKAGSIASKAGRAADAPDTPNAPETSTTPKPPEPAPKTDAFGEPLPDDVMQPGEFNKPAGWDNLGNQPSDIPDQTANRAPGDGLYRPSQDGPPASGHDSTPPAGQDPLSPTARPEAFDGPRSWMDDGSGRGPDWDDYDDGGLLGDRGGSPEPAQHGRVDEAPDRPDEPRDGAADPEPSTESDAGPHADPEPDGLSPDDREFAEQMRHDIDTGEPIPELANLSDREVLSLSDYRGGGYHDMNEALRSQDPEALAAVEHKMQPLDDALAKMPHHDGIVERGINVPERNIDELLERYEPGQVVREDSYTSTASAAPFRGNVNFVIESAQGHDLRNLDLAESEVLFERGTDFLVKDRNYDPSTDTWQINLVDPPK